MAVYWQVTEAAVRRAMSLQDLNPASKTFGCCDRNFWQYRTITSFPAGTMQQLALPFAVLFETNFPGNAWYQHEEMFERARAAMLFWARIQHPAGTVDEWYRHEHSYCATAFTAFGVADACIRLGERLNARDREEITRAVARAAAWLGERFNDAVMNQNLAAAGALWNAHRLTGDTRFKPAFDRMWSRTREHQHAEGWFVEYGGADVGYSLLSLDLLAMLHARGCTVAADGAAPLSRFIAAFAAGHGDLAGRLGSRGTEHSFAFGAEAFAPELPDCRTIAVHLRGAIGRREVADPATIDDRYLAYFYLPSFVQASALGERPLTGVATGTDAAFLASGFRVWVRPGSHVICSTRRNAAFNVYARSGVVHHNLGYWVETSEGRRLASCAWSAEPPHLQERDANIAVEGTFVRVEDQLPLVGIEPLFRAVTQWLFRWPAVAERFHRYIKRRTISKQVRAPLAFSRELAWHAGGLRVTDTIRAPLQGVALQRVCPAADVEVHSPSARQGGASRHDGVVAADEDMRTWARRLNDTGKLVLVTTYAADASGDLRCAGIGEVS